MNGNAHFFEDGKTILLSSILSTVRLLLNNPRNVVFAKNANQKKQRKDHL